jgi:hypothetical protein
MTRPSADAFLAACKRFGVPVVGHTIGGVSWRNHNAGATFDAHILGVHDTRHGGTSDLWPISTAVAFCWKGRIDVPGPLYMGLVAREDARLHMIGWHKTNNAGRTNKAAIDRAWRGLMPMDRELDTPAADDYAGANSVVAGFAFVCNGEPTAAQKRTMDGTLAAYGYACEWSAQDTAGSIADHEELTGRKTDSTRAAHQTRLAVRARFANPLGTATPVPAPAPTPAPVPEVVTWEEVAGKLPILRAGYRDPVGSANYVRRLQAGLVLFGYKLPVDGVYGSATAQAVVAFYKTQLGRDVSGKNFDLAGWRRLHGMR